MLEQKEKFARLATLEMGKRIAESRGEVELSASILKYYADNAETFLAPRPLNSIAGEAYIEYSPLGVLIGVQPWNYPYYQLARFAAPHLTSGNVMLVKHAPGVPQCALAFEQLFMEAGAPAGVYTNVFLSNDQVAKLIDDPRTRGVALTGSERAGESLASRAGKNLKKSTMELGGSDPFIVLEDYDLEDAVKMAVVGRIGNAGQTCIGAKRFIFVGPRFNQFLTMFRAALESLKIGDPFDETTTLGPALIGGRAYPVAEAGRRGGCSWREDPDRRQAGRSQGLFHAGDHPHRHHARQSRVPAGVLRPGRARSCRPRTKRRRSPSLTILRSVWAAPFTPRTSSTANGSPAESRPAWSSSTTLRSAQRTCLSAESRGPAMARNFRISEFRNSSTRS